MIDTIITKELLSTLGSCYLNGDLVEATPTGRLLTDNNLWDKPESQVVEFLQTHGYLDDLKWYEEKKKTEAFVRYNGREITLGTYQVFNPLTGLHNQFQDEASARQEMISIAHQLLEHTKINLIQEISNENGDITWIPTSLSSPLIIS
jgi:hypothetical protein